MLNKMKLKYIIFDVFQRKWAGDLSSFSSYFLLFKRDHKKRGETLFAVMIVTN
jgi:hypothetical protein